MAVRVWRDRLVVSLVLVLAACSGKAGQRPGDGEAAGGEAGSAPTGGPSGKPGGPTQAGGGSSPGSTGGVEVIGGESSGQPGGGRAPDNTAGAPQAAGAGGAVEEGPSIVVSTSSEHTVHESYGNVQVQLALTAPPSANVVVGLASTDTAHAVVYPLSLTFTPENWSKAQTAVVVGVRDSVADDGNSVTIKTLPAVSTDLSYAGLDAADVDVFVIDETDAGIVVGMVTGTTTESGGTATFNIVLTSQPTSTVTIPLSSTDPSEGSVAASVVFEPSDWSTPHLVTVTGVDDALSDGTQLYDVVTGTVVASDAHYAGIDPADVHLSNLDNE